MSEPQKTSTTNTFSESKDLPEDTHNDITKLYIPIIKRVEAPIPLEYQRFQQQHSLAREEKTDFNPKFNQPKSFARQQKGKLLEKTEKIEGIETCNCVRSNCLKLYCVCFSSGNLCGNSCLCRNCKNFHDNMERSEAIIQIIDRDATAFSKGQKNTVGKCACNCRRSNCLKNYCQCYKNQASCGPECCCFDCKNNKSQTEKRPSGQDLKTPKLQSPPSSKKLKTN